MVYRNKMSSASWWLFLAGLGSMTEVHFFGSIALTELAMFVVGPVLFFVNFHRLRREGFMPFVWLTILTCVGCIVASKVNHTYWLFALKGLAVPAVYFVAIVTFHHLLRKDFSAMKWFLIGAFCSSIVSIFVFQQATYTVDASAGELMTGADATAGVMGYALFWSSRINALLKLPVSCFYFATPSVYCCGSQIVGAVVSILFSQGSGRAAAAAGIVGAALLFVGGKSPRRIAKLGKYILIYGIVGVVFAFALKETYASLAVNGKLGYKAQQKYLKQTAAGKSALAILMAGRMELFCGLFACVDKPIIGWGPMAEDTGGYVANYLSKYASDEDFERYVNSVQADAIYGYRRRMIPAHSHIEAAWLHYGIFGLILWLYVFFLMYKYLRSYAASIPQWFGYLASGLCGMVWTIFFSPPGGRLGDMFFVACLLCCRAVAKNKMALPHQMQIEISKQH